MRFLLSQISQKFLVVSELAALSRLNISGKLIFVYSESNAS